MRHKSAVSAFFLVLFTTVCLQVFPAAAASETLVMATTTSTDNTGLLDYLVPEFEKDSGIEVKWTATGTGKALELGRRCDVDVILVHAPPAEKAYIDNGYGKNRRQIMYNDFVIIGPAADPAGIKGESVDEALRAVKSSENLFVSRGDDSGTNKKELLLWENAGLKVPDKEKWYIQTGQGMLATINVAQEKNGYTITDRGTYIKYQSDRQGAPPLTILAEGDDILINQYSVIAVDPENCPDAENELAMAFSDWMAGSRAQKLIKEFRLLGKPLFVPNAE